MYMSKPDEDGLKTSKLTLCDAEDGGQWLIDASHEHHNAEQMYLVAAHPHHKAEEAYLLERACSSRHHCLHFVI